MSRRLRRPDAITAARSPGKSEQGTIRIGENRYLSPYFVTKPERMESILEDAYILINEKK